MTVALENHLVGLLTGCVAHWRDGKYAQADCTLKFILDWAWERLTHTKQGCYSVLSRVSLSGSISVNVYFRQSPNFGNLLATKTLFWPKFLAEIDKAQTCACLILLMA